ncbi:hypothetical protein [Sediminibacillus massiliensis]|uniref:hypothetical protein n=1 Tax=Sediminibacillus massiliensis TaxID=1926277 RepID=UPI0009888EDE|nr:hypothetical protein [Sediminibacillus massiliensis]
MDKVAFENFCEQHIKELEKKLEDIYTIERPENYPNKSIEKINVLSELHQIREIEDIYSVIKNSGVNEGEVYSQYSEWLENVQQSVELLQTKKEEIEKNNAADIKNIKLLIEKFKSKL